METRTKAPFKDYNQALAFFRYKNPARQKFINFLEPQRGSNNYTGPLDPNHGHRIFAAIAVSLADTKRNCARDKWQAFESCKVCEDLMHPRDFAARLRVTPACIYSWIGSVAEVFTKELVNRSLIDERVFEKERFSDARANYEKFKEEKAKQDKKAKSATRPSHLLRRGRNGTRQNARILWRATSIDSTELVA